jgi:hypothetical protein
MQNKNLIITIVLFLGFISISANAQGFYVKKPEKKQAAKPAAKPASETGLKPYQEIITKDAKTSVGFLTTHEVKRKYYFEIPDSLLNRDILIVNRISKAPVNRYKSTVGYPGDQIGENVIQFEKGRDNKIFIRNMSYLEYSQDTLGMYQSVKNSNIQPIVATFDIKAVKKDSVSKSQNSVIEMTDFLNADNDILFFDSRMKRNRGVGGFQKDKSFVDTIKAFPLNIEIVTVKTYTQSAPKGLSPMAAEYYPTGPMTYELNSSMVLLPEKPMKPRFYDPRVGYFAVRYTDFDVNPQGIEQRAMITRWRLEPKDEDMEKYKRGELVEPKKPIVFYIDPATPRRWVPYLVAGVNDWQKAFEKAGFKNAIYALEAPQDDPSWSLEDARHSAIVYKPSTIPNASGPHVHDPRSGEIIETHINWYHNVMSLLRNWYMIQAGAVDTGAQKLLFDDELMGELIRFVSSHEVGHTLGLRHNFGSSATVPVENLRNKEWVEANGHTPSIMDYARFNYIAQPEDNISRAGIFPRIGIYDDWSVEWGYRYLPQFDTADDERSYLNKWIISKLNEDRRYTFGTETDPDDPRNQNEDLGDNAMLASTYGIKNLQRIVPNILIWTKEPDKGYQSANEIYVQVATQYNRYMGHVAKNVAGIYTTPRTVEEAGVSREYVPANLQKDAVSFLNKELFTTPAWLIDKDLIEKAQVNPINTIENVQKNILGRLLSKRTLDKMLENEAYNGSTVYTVHNMFDDLNKNIWAELTNGKQIDIYRRNLQKNYVNGLIALASARSLPATASSAVGSDASNIARAQLVKLRSSIRSAANSSSGMKQSHLQGLLALIDIALDTTK